MRSVVAAVPKESDSSSDKSVSGSVSAAGGVGGGTSSSVSGTRHRSIDMAAQGFERVGRYILHPPIARGGMATVHTARLVAGEGIVQRLVAIKRLHPHYVEDPEMIEMFHDEARIASRIHHPNVVPVLDVIRSEREMILVQEYVDGVPLNYLFKLAMSERVPIPAAIAASIVCGILAGLHAAHEATDEMGEPLGIVHRDVSPQNVIVSIDGIPRLVDFGIAKAKTSTHHTREGFFKGKLAYMAPEQLRAEAVTRQTDVYSAGVLLWELLANRRFHEGKNDLEFVKCVVTGNFPTASAVLAAERAEGNTLNDERWDEILLLEPVLVRAMAINPQQRFATALEMAEALVKAMPIAKVSEVAAWVRKQGATFLEQRRRILVSNEEQFRASAGRLRIDTPPASISSGPRALQSLAAFINEDERETLADPHERASHASPDPDDLKQTLELRRATGRFSVTAMFTEETPRWLPWTAIGALLIIVAVLSVLMIVRRDPPPAVAAPAPKVVAPVVTAVVPSMPAPTSPSATTTVSTPARSEPPPQQRPVVVITRVAPAPVVVQAPPAARPSASTPPADCNPPFYFEGSKKIFKQNCL
jgi:eukaryotic-like serine/threonine-protein kinase